MFNNLKCTLNTIKKPTFLQPVDWVTSLSIRKYLQPYFNICGCGIFGNKGSVTRPAESRKSLEWLLFWCPEWSCREVFSHWWHKEGNQCGDSEIKDHYWGTQLLDLQKSSYGKVRWVGPLAQFLGNYSLDKKLK